MLRGLACGSTGLKISLDRVDGKAAERIGALIEGCVETREAKWLASRSRDGLEACTFVFFLFFKSF